MQYKITMVKTITDPHERKQRLLKLWAIFCNNKPAYDSTPQHPVPTESIQTGNPSQDEAHHEQT